MNKEYITIKKENHEEIIINKSKFIGHIYPINCESKAKDIIEMVKSNYTDATHNCSAYYIKSKNIQKFDDDGEPGGTAGMPIIQAIIHKNIDCVVVIITRYFGGIKLGAGGLVRAYSKITSKVIDSAIHVKMIPGYICELFIDYQYQGKIEYFLRSRKIEIEENNFSSNVRYLIKTSMNFELLLEKIVELTNGSGKCKVIDDTYIKENIKID